MDETEDWLARSDAEIVNGWRAAWWIEARSYQHPDREQRRIIAETDPVRFAVMRLVLNDPGRALQVAFRIARAADHPAMLLNVGVGILQELLKADPTLWDAIATEAATSPGLLHAIGQMWEVDVPQPLADACRASQWAPSGTC